MTVAVRSPVENARASAPGSVVALCGGVGGAKLALGLYHVLAPDRLTVIVNPGDDFDHLGLRICPDLDTVLYTLGAVADSERGWGRADETWNFMAALDALGGPTWFRLGDKDLAMHVERTRWLHEGRALSEFAEHARRKLGIAAHIVPGTDDRIATVVVTDEGELPFQRYFVERRCEPKVREIRFVNAEEASASTAALRALDSDDLQLVVICPSNPLLSIDPLLSIRPLREVLGRRRVPRIAVSPLIGGRAVKGPTAKIFGELGIGADNASIANHYAGLIDALVIDIADAGQAPSIHVPVCVAETLMISFEQRVRLARRVLEFGSELGPRLVSASHDR